MLLTTVDLSDAKGVALRQMVRAYLFTSRVGGLDPRSSFTSLVLRRIGTNVRCQRWVTS